MRKEQKKALKATAGATADDVDEGNEGSEGEEDVSGYIGVSAVRAAGSSKEKLLSNDEKATSEAEEEDIEAFDSQSSSLKEVLDGADVVIEVLDARDPLAYHSQHLEELVQAKEGQKLLLVLNKIGAFIVNSSHWVVSSTYEPLQTPCPARPYPPGSLTAALTTQHIQHSSSAPHHHSYPQSNP